MSMTKVFVEFVARGVFRNKLQHGRRLFCEIGEKGSGVRKRRAEERGKGVEERERKNRMRGVREAWTADEEGRERGQEGEPGEGRERPIILLQQQILQH